MNWISKGAVTKVKRQGRCGASWAFAAIGAVEAQHFRKTGKLVTLSEQNLVDCAAAGNCDRGNKASALFYIMRNGGVDTEESYPYEEKMGKCRIKKLYRTAAISKVCETAEGDEHELQEAIATAGPVAVSINAHRKSFMLYKEGVYYDPECTAENLSHDMLVVGYGIDRRGQEYYIVKNSWGTTWGSKGYIRMARNRRNNCGIATDADYPLA